jgi:cation:H+ antiporter
VYYLLIIIGFIFLIKGADFLVDGASSLAKELEVSELVIGLTVVSFGTSSPELFVNLLSSIQGNVGIAIGNVLGSNIANVLLILGVSSIIFPLTVGKGTVWKEIPLSLLAAVLLGVMANDYLIDKSGYSTLTKTDGIVFISFFIIFLYYSFSIAKSLGGINEYTPRKTHSLNKSVLLIIIGLAGLALGGKWTVESAVYFAEIWEVSHSLIGLTIVAIGTSLPELATSAVAAYKKNVEIAIGNVVGSNIFNIFLVLGISSLIGHLPFDIKLNVDIAVLIMANFLLFLFMFTGKKSSLDRWEGILFVGMYIGYISYIVNRG